MHAELTYTHTVVILTFLRGMYSKCLEHGRTVDYSLFTQTGTLAGALTEVGPGLF